LPIGSGTVVDALTAVVTTGIRRRDDFRSALRAVLVKDPGDFRFFDQVFHLYFRNPRLLRRIQSELLPLPGEAPPEPGPDAVVRRLLESFAPAIDEGAAANRTTMDPSGSFSAREMLRCKDFDRMSQRELEDARRMLQETPNPAETFAARRYRASHFGRRYDFRKSMQTMLRCYGQPIQLARRVPRERPQALVLLCDISGSMTRYSRMFLHYAHALANHYRAVQVFVFGTRLTNISRWIRESDVDEALGRVAAKVPDWDGGTRIAHCLQRFNVDWSRRVPGSSATVVLLSDGLERDAGAGLEFQMQRLRRSCRQLIWMNPMLRYAEFEPRASGIRAMLPHVDRFVAAHNVVSLHALGQLLGNVPTPRIRQSPSAAA
jgi:hypothetical protein